MRLVVETFKQQKAGNAPDEYEDASSPDTVDGEVDSFRVAVSDGATETSFSGLWAGILAEAFADARLGFGTLRDELTLLQRRWRDEVGNKPLPWYAEEKLRSGAFATLAGLRIEQSRESGGGWTAVAVGDSCVFHIRGDKVLQSFPLDHSEQFNTRPLLISSNQSNNGQLETAVRTLHGTWTDGDRFFLMTDALACYFLRLWETSDDRKETLAIFDGLDAEEFCQRIKVEREQLSPDTASLLKNDDVTFVRCRVGRK